MSMNVKEHTGATARVPGHVDHGGRVDLLDGPVVRDSRRSAGGLLQSAWHFLISMRTGLWIIIVLGLLTLLGTLLMQAPPEALADPKAYREWFEAGPAVKYGGWAPILAALGLLNVFSTWYFLALFALLALSILACSVNRAPRLWHTATRPRVSMSDAFFSHAPLAATLVLPVGVEDAAARVRAGLRAQRFRVVAAGGEGGPDLYGDRFRWGPFGTVVAHLSFVVILAGFVVSATLGFKVSSFVAPIGSPVEVGHGTGLTVTALSFHDAYYEDGTPRDYVSDVVLTRDGRTVAQQDVRVNDPLRFEGVWFHQAAFGIGVDLTARREGAPVFSSFVTLDYAADDGTTRAGVVDAPADGIDAVWVIQAESGRTLTDLPPGTVALEVHRTGAAEPDFQVVEQGRPVQVGDLTYTFERNRQYTVLSVNRDPGAWLVWTGSIALIAGSMLVFFLPHRRVWVRIRPDGGNASSIELAAPLKRDPAFEPAFADLVHRLSADS